MEWEKRTDDCTARWLWRGKIMTRIAPSDKNI